MKRWLIIGAVLAGAAASASLPTAAAVTYKIPKYESAPPEGKPSFCDESTVHDPLAPLRRMRKLHSPLPSGRLGFGPARLLLKTSPPLLVAGGNAGYSLSLRRGPSVHPDWTVTTALARVDEKGRVVKVIKQRRRQVSTIRPGRGVGIRFAIADKPAAYKITISFRNERGHKLGAFGFYALAVPPSANARIGLSPGPFYREQTVFARVKNFGTASVLFGASYTIERLEKQEWTKAPESPNGPWPSSLLMAVPGKTGPCDEFRIPPFTPGGQYRLVKDIAYVSGPGQSLSAQVSAEFEIFP